MDFGLGAATLIVHFQGVIPGNAAANCLPLKWFVLLGFKKAESFGGLTGDMGAQVVPVRGITLAARVRGRARRFPQFRTKQKSRSGTRSGSSKVWTLAIREWTT